MNNQLDRMLKEAVADYPKYYPDSDNQEIYRSLTRFIARDSKARPSSKQTA
jgi:hypothetical protein